VNGQLYVPDALSPGNEHAVSVGYEAKRTTEPVRMLWRKVLDTVSKPTPIQPLAP
jgi:hypothetical protein